MKHMDINHTSIIDEVKLRYAIIHTSEDLEQVLNDNFSDMASNFYDIEDSTYIFQLDVITDENNNGNNISIVNLNVLDMPYDFIINFEKAILDINDILEVYKTYDSYRLEQNREYLKELYDIEMKIREIYTVLKFLQHFNLKYSQVILVKKHQDNLEAYRKRLMNEFYFIQFSDYKNIDIRVNINLRDFVNSLKDINEIKDIKDIVNEISHPTLFLEERFNELSRIPEAIGRLEEFRNNIAHNRSVSRNNIENFNKAKIIINDVYSNFLTKIKDKKI